jgi:hypothetical protein
MAMARGLSGVALLELFSLGVSTAISCPRAVSVRPMSQLMRSIRGVRSSPRRTTSKTLGGSRESAEVETEARGEIFGWLLEGETLTRIDVPGAIGTIPLGINESARSSARIRMTRR